MKTRGRLTAGELESYIPDQKSIALNTTASNALLPIPYGTVSVPGTIAAYGFESPLRLVVLVLWGAGECHSINTTYINDVDAADIGNVRYRHYRGATWQEVDQWLEDVIVAYSDDLVLSKPSGDMGICATVYRIPVSDLGSAPRFQAIIEGRLVYDPDSPSNGDPFYDDVGFSVTFTDTSPNNTATDDSTNGHTVTFYGDAHVANNELVLDGTGDYVEIADDATVEFGTGPWSAEIRVKPNSVTGTQYLLSKDSIIAGNLGLALYMSDDDLGIALSSDGLTHDIQPGGVIESSVFTIGEYTDVKVEFTGQTYFALVNGSRVWQTNNTATLYDNTRPWQIGASVALFPLDGAVSSVRYTKNYIRYGVEHKVLDTASPQGFLSSPFADSSTYQAGHVFSDNPALCFAELASNSIYGMGATVSGLSEAAAWCDDLLGGAVERSRISLLINQARKTDEWLDLLASYADCQWINEGDGVTIIPDMPVGVTNPSGQELATNPEFDSDGGSPESEPYWTYGTGWGWSNALVNGFAVCASQSPEITATLSQAIVGSEAGAEYVIEIFAPLISSGSISVDFDGVEVIAAQSTGGTFKVRVTNTTGSPVPLLEIISHNATAWLFKASIKRLYWLEENFVQNSITLDGVSNNDTPTKVTLRYKESATDSPNWLDKTESYELPGVSSGDVPLIETTLSMPGIFREAEAQNKAQSRLARMQNRVRVSWVTTDHGLAYLRGTAVQVRNTNRSIDIVVLVETVEMISYGRYRVTGLRYDEAHYTSELSEGTGTVPVGAIVLSSDGTIPTGWAEYTDANGKLIKAWSESVSPHEVPGDTGGDATYAGFSGNTSTDGAHGETGNTLFNVYDYDVEPTGIPDDYIQHDDAEYGDHLHTWSTGSFDPNYYRRENILIKKTGSASVTFPQEAMVFGLGGLLIENLSRTVAYQNRLLYAASANANAGAANRQLNITTGSTDDSHDHHEDDSDPGSIPNDFSNAISESITGGGPHTHDVTLTVSRSVKRYKLALYAGTDDFTVDTGIIILWDGALTGSPEPFPNWYICDGTNGTPDLRDYFIEIAANGQEDTTAGDNTLSISGTTDSKSHTHDDNQVVESKGVTQVAHSNSVSHSHTITDSDDHTPAHHVVYFLMYKAP